MGKLRIWNNGTWEEIKGAKGDPGPKGETGSPGPPISQEELNAAVLTGIQADNRIPALESRANGVDATITRIKKRIFDASEYGVLGTSNDSPTFQAATDAARVAGGTVTAPPGFYQMGEQIVGADGVDYDFPTKAVFDFANMATPPSTQNAAMYFAGSTTALPVLASIHTKGGSTLTFASAHGLVAGDVVQLYNPTDFSFSNSRNYYRDGEFARVAWVLSTTQVMITSDLMTTHPTTTQVFRVNPIRFSLRGGTFIFKRGNPGLKVRYGVDISIKDLNLTNSVLNQLWIDRCYNVDVSGVKAREFQDPLGTASNYTHYGMIIGNSQNVFMDKCHLESGRHGLTTGGDAEVGCVPSRNIYLSDSYVTGWGSGETGVTSVSGLSLHGNIEYFRASNCVFPRGVGLGGNHIALIGCDIQSNLYGHLLGGSEFSGADITVQGNRFTATRNVVGESWIRIVWGSPTAANLTDTMVISENLFDFGTFESASIYTWGMFIDNKNGNLSGPNRVIATDNTFRTRRGSVSKPMFGMVIRGQFRVVDVSGTRGNIGLRLLDMTAQMIDINGVRIDNAPSDGITVAYESLLYSRPVVSIVGSRVIWARGCGMDIGGVAGVDLIMSDSVSKECNTGGAETGNRSSSMYIHDFQDVVLSNLVVGAEGGGMANAYALANIVRCTELDTIIIGSVTAIARSGLLAYNYRGGGAGAPAFAAAKGSTYMRTDGGAGTTYYVNETGNATWAAK